MTFYDLLLHLYPQSFRNEYGEEMRAMFQQRRTQASVLGAVPLWIGTLAEVVANAALVQLDILKQDLAYSRRMLTRVEALLAGVKPADALTLGIAMALCALMTVLGGLAPTLRALRVDPITALRTE